MRQEYLYECKELMERWKSGEFTEQERLYKVMCILWNISINSAE